MYHTWKFAQFLMYGFYLAVYCLLCVVIHKSSRSRHKEVQILCRTKPYFTFSIDPICNCIRLPLSCACSAALISRRTDFIVRNTYNVGWVGRGFECPWIAIYAASHDLLLGCDPRLRLDHTGINHPEAPSPRPIRWQMPWGLGPGQSRSVNRTSVNADGARDATKLSPHGSSYTPYP